MVVLIKRPPASTAQHIMITQNKYGTLLPSLSYGKHCQAHPYDILLATAGGEEPIVRLWVPDQEPVPLQESINRELAAAGLPPPQMTRGRGGGGGFGGVDGGAMMMMGGPAGGMPPWQDPGNLLIAVREEWERVCGLC
jgi:hypothetical protein